MSPEFILVLLVVLLALAFDYSNGFHDAANSIATIVATRVLRPLQAVAWAAFFNFVAAFTFDVNVAKTIGKGIVLPAVVDVHVIMATLAGAIGWNIVTWLLGLPTSSSHALVGGLVGAALIKAGTGGIVAPGLVKTASFIVLAPCIGMALGATLMTAATWLVHGAHMLGTRGRPAHECPVPGGWSLWRALSAPGSVSRWSRGLQLVSSAAYSLGHGMNDAQKTMGIIAVLLVSMRSHVRELQNAPSWAMPPQNLEQIPWWIILAAHAAIALGTLSGGWRIVKTMGMRITDLKPLSGVCAESAGALTLIALALRGIPVSTTHTITGAIVGVGASRRLSAVRWGVAAHIVWAWVLTIPAAATLSALCYTVAAFLWPALPQAGQGLFAAALVAGLLWWFARWLQSARTAPAHG